VTTETPIRSPQQLFWLSGIVQVHANQIAQLFVGDSETMLGDSSSHRPVHDQLAVLPRAMCWLRRITLGVEEPSQNRRPWRSSRRVGPIDHEHAVAGELRTVGTHLPVVLHDDLITDIELEDDHRSCCSRRTPG
jgi:hypothetical protein